MIPKTSRKSKINTLKSLEAENFAQNGRSFLHLSLITFWNFITHHAGKESKRKS